MLVWGAEGLFLRHACRPPTLDLPIVSSRGGDLNIAPGSDECYVCKSQVTCYKQHAQQSEGNMRTTMPNNGC